MIFNIETNHEMINARFTLCEKKYRVTQRCVTGELDHAVVGLMDPAHGPLGGVCVLDDV